MPIAAPPDARCDPPAAAGDLAAAPAPDALPPIRVRLGRDEQGTTLLELLMVLALLSVVVGASFAFLVTSTREQRRDQAFGQAVASTQAAVARFTHDLRSATRIVSASPNAIEFLLRNASGVTYDIEYDCTRADSLGGAFRRCARLQSTYPAALPAAPASARALDIQHVSNGSITTYCNGGGTGPSGSVLFYGDPTLPDANPTPPACDETYEETIAGLAPPYVQVAIKVPASGDLTNAGLTHTTTFTTAVYLRNQDSGA